MLNKLKQMISDPYFVLFSMLFVILSVTTVSFSTALSTYIQVFAFYFFIATILLLLLPIVKQSLSKGELVLSPLFFLPSVFVFVALISTALSPAHFYSFLAYLNNADSLLVLFLLTFLFHLLVLSNKQNFYNNLLKVLQLSFIISFIPMALYLLSTLTELYKFPVLSLSPLEYSIFAALVLILSTLQESKSKKETILKYVSITISTVTLVLLNTYISWLILLAGSAAALYFKFKVKLQVKTWMISAVLFLSLIFTVFGAQFANLSAKYAGVNVRPEARPSLVAGLMILQNSYNDSIKNKLIGTGPASFAFDWFKYKSNDTRNTGIYWNISFNNSSNSVLHFFTVFGIAGGALWLALLFAIFSYLFKFGFSANHKRLSNNIILSSYIALFTLSLSFIFYSPSIVFLTLFFVLLANFILALREKSLLKTLSLKDSRLIKIKSQIAPWIVRSFAIVALYIAFVVPASAALVYVKSSAHDISTREKYAKISLYLMPVRAPIYDELANIAATKLRMEVASKQAQDAKKGRKLTQLSYVTDMVNWLKKAKNVEPENFRRYLALASAQALRYSISKDEADYKSAENNLATAARLAPQHPYVYFTASYLASVKGDYKTVKQALLTAVALKPDFKDAYNALFDVALMQNNTKEAVAVAQLELQNNPNDFLAWKRLAIAFYNNKQYKEAELTVKSILQRYPDGLQLDRDLLQILVNALQAQGKNKEAVERLKELSKRFKDEGIYKMVEALTKSQKQNISANEESEGEGAEQDKTDSKTSDESN